MSLGVDEEEVRKDEVVDSYTLLPPCHEEIVRVVLIVGEVIEEAQ
jgi:hypothetical protein